MKMTVMKRSSTMPENNSDRLVRDKFQGLLADIRRFCTPFYVAILIMAVYALWEARTPVTMIAPFQVAKSDIPFTGDVVADVVQDGLQSIRNEIDEERRDTSLKSSDTGLPDLRNMLIPDWRVQAPPRFTVEVKGVSYERILSAARAVLGTETTISGDVVLKNRDEFVLIARIPGAGPWESGPEPTTAEGLKRAGRDLAEKILIRLDPTVAGVALLQKGQVEEGLDVLNRARSLKPSDARLKLNLCMGFAATRRYDDALECYKGVLQMTPNSPQEILDRLAQVYYLKGDRDVAIEHYKELRKQGYTDALLGLGEAWDDTGRHKDALDAYDEFLAVERMDRKLAIAHVKRSAALAHLGRHEEALEEYKAALKYAPRDVLILVHQGLEMSQARDLDAGIAKLQSVVNENPNSESLAFARLQLGVLLEQNGGWRRAIEQYQLAADLRPSYVEARLKLAHALAHEGEQAKAFEQYEEVARRSASDLQRGYSQIFAQQWLANELRSFGNYASAASAYREAIRFKPDDSAAHCQLALILARQGRLSQAVHEYGAALVPAKLEELNDSQCLVMIDQVLEEAVAGRGPGHAQALAELRQIKQGIRNDAQSARARNKPGPVQQAVLRTGDRVSKPW
jgi:tetratricopeptide (TPR) repeat protein